jgi:hypothetical protein
MSDDLQADAANRIRAATGLSFERCQQVIEVLPPKHIELLLEIFDKMKEAAPVPPSRRRRWLGFTIRDLLWLTLVVALAVGWWIDRSAIRGELDNANWQRGDYVIRNNELERELRTLRPKESATPNLNPFDSTDAGPSAPF